MVYLEDFTQSIGRADSRLKFTLRNGRYPLPFPPKLPNSCIPMRRLRAAANVFLKRFHRQPTFGHMRLISTI